MSLLVPGLIRCWLVLTACWLHDGSQLSFSLTPAQKRARERARNTNFESQIKAPYDAINIIVVPSTVS